ncbi:MAG: RnfABCDGE type electron transport complex subunit G [Desulfobacterales bacterium]|jgi:electron transport complex protein RnfG
MREMIKMVIVLTILSTVSGGLLAYVKVGTKDRIDNQVLQLVKGPAIRSILAGASNDPIADRFSLPDGEVEVDFFVGKFDGQPKTVVLEGFGKGYAGDIGLMVAVDVAQDQIYGVEVTTHSETAGLGSRVKDDPAFAGQFKGQPLDKPVQVAGDGGSINALSGATISSRAVCAAASEATQIYQRLKPQIEDKLKSLP